MFTGNIKLPFLEVLANGHFLVQILRLYNLKSTLIKREEKEREILEKHYFEKMKRAFANRLKMPPDVPIRRLSKI